MRRPAPEGATRTAGQSEARPWSSVEGTQSLYFRRSTFDFFTATWPSLRLLLALIGSPIALGAQQRGLLIAFDSDSTIWLTVSNATGDVRRGPGLLVPRRVGFWRVGTEQTFIKRRDAPDTAGADSSELGDWYTTSLWASAVGHAPVTPIDSTLPVDDWAAYGGSRTVAVTFVGPDYFAVDDDLEQDGPMLAYDRTLYIGSLDSLEHVGYARRGFGGRPRDARLTPRVLRANFANCVRWSRQHGDIAIDADAPGDESWGIVRAPGRWTYVRRFGFGTGVARGNYTDCDVSIRPPSAMVGKDLLAPSWSIVKRRIPKARDAFSSPSGDLLIVLTDSAAHVYRPRGTRLGRAIFQTPVPPGKVIMAEWATGSTIDDWTRALGTLLTGT